MMSSQPTLKEVKAEFERWRAKRKNCREMIPQSLQHLAKQLAERYSATDIVRELRLNYARFKSFLEANRNNKDSTTQPKSAKNSKTADKADKMVTFSTVNLPMPIHHLSAFTAEIRQPDGQMVVLHANTEQAIAMIIERVALFAVGGNP